MSTLTTRTRAPSIVADLDGLVTTFVIVPPDGGWGWVVVAASFFVQMLFGATLFSISDLVEAVAEDFHVTMAEASVYSSLFGGCALCIGPVVSAMAHKFGFRTVTTVGAVIGTLGFVGASFADSLPVLIFSFGILGGIGFGMLFVPSIIVAVFYFDRWRALVQGITVCGSSVGGAIAPPIITMATKRLGWRNTTLIEAGMIITCGLASLLYVPLKPMMVRVTPVEMSHAVRHGASVTHQVRARCDLTVWTSPSYLMFGLSGILCMLAIMTPFVYLPDRSRRIGVDETTVDLLIPVANVFSTLGRLACGVLASHPRYPIAVPILGVTLFASGASLCLSGLSTDSAFQIVSAIFFGLFLAAFNALRLIILVELIGLERLTTAFGYLLFTQGCSVMIGPPLAGSLKELTGEYDSVFWLSGGLLLASSLFMFPLRCINRWEKARAKARAGSQ